MKPAADAMASMGWCDHGLVQYGLTQMRQCGGQYECIVVAGEALMSLVGAVSSPDNYHVRIIRKNMKG